MAFTPMLWNKARRDFYVIARASLTGMQPLPGGTWPTCTGSSISNCRFAMSILQFAISLVCHVVHGDRADALEESET